MQEPGRGQSAQTLDYSECVGMHTCSAVRELLEVKQKKDIASSLCENEIA